MYLSYEIMIPLETAIFNQSNFAIAQRVIAFAIMTISLAHHCKIPLSMRKN